jgi:hypothetical protein
MAGGASCRSVRPSRNEETVVTTTHAQAAPTAAMFARAKGANLGELRDSGGRS